MPDNTKRWQVTVKNTSGSKRCWDFLYKTSSEASMASVVEDLTQEGYELMGVQLVTPDDSNPATNETRQIDVFDSGPPLLSLSSPIRFWDGG